MANGVSAIGAPGTVLTQGTSRNISEMSGMDFLRLLITQLTNQDPLEPMKNQELLEQLSAIRSLESNMTISENFKKLLGHQELASATLLIGRVITGLDSRGLLVEGRVERIIMDGGGIRAQVGDHEIALKNVTGVRAEANIDAA